MRADFSRLTFDPSKDYAGVLHQQGRVWLDADWNEDVLTRLDMERKLTADLVGAVGAPPPGTALRILPLDDPTDQLDFLIGGGAGGAGHYFVDGVLCRLSTNTLYSQQADFPGAPAPILSSSIQSLRALVYLEVWRRLITYVEDASVREIALGGPDTATRLKTVAQVRLLPIDFNDATINAGNARGRLPKPGQGTLTTLQPTNSVVGDPCRLPDPTTFSGRQNRLYRVEIHNSGDVTGSTPPSSLIFQMNLAQNAAAPALTIVLQGALTSSQIAALKASGAALLSDNAQSETVIVADVFTSGGQTQVVLGGNLSGSYATSRNAALQGGMALFKWSGNNAAFAVNVLDVDPLGRTLTLSSLGQDQTTALAELDLVEISDDAAELGGSRGFLTTLASNPDPDQFTVTLANPLPPTLNVTHNMTLRRWDGVGWASAVYSDTGTPDMNLGDGVSIQFGGSDLRPGDYWLFTARTADGSVGPLTNAPPNGIERAYAPLAIVNWTPQVWFDFNSILAAVQLANQPSTPVQPLLNQLTTVQQTGIVQGQPMTALDLSRLVALAQAVGTAPSAIQVITNGLNQRASGSPPVGVSRVTLQVEEDCRSPFNPLAPPTIRITDIRTLSPNLSLLNDQSISVDAIVQGLEVIFSNPVDPASLGDRPVCQVDVALPFPFPELLATNWGSSPIGTVSLTLDANITLDATGQTLTWVPTQPAASYLQQLLFLKTIPVTGSPPKGPAQAFAHLTLKGRFIWSGPATTGPMRWLDGEAMGVPRPTLSTTGLSLPSGNSHRGGDFAMWIRLLKSAEPSAPVIQTFSVDSSQVTGGTQITGAIILVSPTINAVTINLSSNNAAVTFPNGSVTIPAGGVSINFASGNTTPVAIDTTVVLTARLAATSPPTFDGPHTVSVTVQRPRLTGVKLVGSTSTAISLSQPAPATFTAEVDFSGPMPATGLALTVNSDNPAVVAVAAANPALPANATSVNFNASTSVIHTQPTQVNINVILTPPIGGGPPDVESLPIMVGGSLASVSPTNMTLTVGDTGTLTLNFTCVTVAYLSVLVTAPTLVTVLDTAPFAEGPCFNIPPGTLNFINIPVVAQQPGTGNITFKQNEQNGGLPAVTVQIVVNPKPKSKDGKEGKDKEKEKEHKDKDKDTVKDKEGHVEVKLPYETEPRRLRDLRPAIVVGDEDDPLVWVRILAMRVDELEKRLAGSRAFILPEERPDVGRKAIDQADGDGRGS